MQDGKYALKAILSDMLFVLTALSSTKEGFVDDSAKVRDHRNKKWSRTFFNKKRPPKMEGLVGTEGLEPPTFPI
jgi:hypothetical protein